MSANHQSPITNHVGNGTRENIMIRQGKKAFFVACNLFSATCLALLLAPSAALADDECGPGPSVTCAADADFSGSGVTYDSGVDFSLEALGDLDVGNPGLVITGTGAASLTVDVSAGALEGNGGITLSNAAGDIDLTMAEVDGPINATGGAGTLTINFAPVFLPGGIDPEVALDTGDLSVTGEHFVLNIESVLTSTEPEDLDWFSEHGAMLGALDLSDITDTAEITIRELNRWQATGSSLLSEGNSTVNIEEGGFLHTELAVGGNHVLPPATVDAPTVIDFSTGNNSLNNEGIIAVGSVQFTGGGGLSEELQRNREGELRLLNLDTFNNAGDIYLGLYTRSATTAPSTDFWPDDILSMEGATFNGLPGSRLFIDVNLNSAASQNSCSADLRDPDSGDLPTADCVNIKNGATQGQTGIVINELVPGDRGAYNPDGITLIDVAGGDSAAGHFVIDPDSSGYSSQFGGIVDKGFFFYPLDYDPATQQHKLYGLPSGSAYQTTLLAHAAQGLWRSANGSLFERQTDVRAALPAQDDLQGNAWIRVNNESADREARPGVTAGGQTFTFNNDYTQDNLSLTIGRDFIVADNDHSAFVVGGMIGYGQADIHFDSSSNTANLEGMMVGAYGSYFLGDFFVDALVSGNFLETDFDVPGLDLQPDSAILSTDIATLGAQVEGGWAGLQFGRIGIEPLVGLSWVRAAIDDIEVPADDPIRIGANVQYDDDPASFRGSLGLRVSADNLTLLAPRAGVSFTARVIEEFDGEAKAAIENVGPVDAPVNSTLDGTFVRLNGGLSLANASGSVSGLLNVSGEFGDDYESVGLSAGFRYQW